MLQVVILEVMVWRSLCCKGILENYEDQKTIVDCVYSHK